MSRFTGWIKPLLVVLAVTAASVMGFLGIRRIKNRVSVSSKPTGRSDRRVSTMNKIAKFVRTPIGIAIAVAIAAILAAGVFVLVKKLVGPPKPPEFAAVVNGGGIPYSNYQTRLDAQTYFYTTIDPRSPEELVQIQYQVIEDMIQENLLTQELAKHGVSVSDEVIRQRIQQEVIDVYLHDEEDPWGRYSDILTAHYHTTLEEVMRTFRLESLREHLGPLATKKHVFGIWIYKTAVGGDPARPIPEGKTEEEINRPKKEFSQGIFDKTKSGEDFSLLARESSEHKEGASRGGDLGFLAYPTDEVFVHNEMIAGFPGLASLYKAVRELNTGETKFYEQFNGYLVVRVTEVAEGPLGTGQSFEEWYAALRSKADISLEKNVMTPTK